MKRVVYFLTAALLSMVACQDNWDEHYEGKEGNIEVSPLNLLEYIKSKGENYSRFVEVLENTGLAEQLTMDQNLTVWLVDNEGMQQLEELANNPILNDTLVMQYHINYLVVRSNQLYEGYRMRSLNGKYISTKVENETYYVAESKVIATDQFCQNGVVHEIEGMMTPVISIYDYLLSLDNEYSIIVDSITNRNDTIFDAENSIPLGVDEEGNTVYDSVFVIENPMFEDANFISEFEQYTMFIPNNDVIENTMQTLADQLSSIGQAIEREDTLLAWDWIMGSLFYDGIIRNIGTEDLISVTGNVWRPTIQQVDMDWKEMSNGIAYDVTFMKIPNNVYISRIKSLIHYYEFIPDGDEEKYLTVSNATAYYPRTTDSWDFSQYGYGRGTYKILFAQGANPGDDQKLSVEFSPLKVEVMEDNSQVASEIKIPAGEYKLYLGFQSKNHPFVNVYFNGELVGEDLNVSASTPWNYDRVTETVVSKYNGLGGLVNIVNVEGEGLQSVKIKVEFNRLGTGSSEELKLYHWALVPTENNY